MYLVLDRAVSIANLFERPVIDALLVHVVDEVIAVGVISFGAIVIRLDCFGVKETADVGRDAGALSPRLLMRRCGFIRDSAGRSVLVLDDGDVGIRKSRLGLGYSLTTRSRLGYYAISTTRPSRVGMRLTICDCFSIFICSQST